MNGQLKRRALLALKGNWQTALLVSFCAGIIGTGLDLAQRDIGFDLYAADLDALWQSIWASLSVVPESTWVLIVILRILGFVFTPALQLGCCHYFVSRLNGEELGFRGLFSRMQIVGKSILLSLLITLKVFAWSLLFIIPGFIAEIRYSMAPYYMAEDPSLSVTEAIEKSKQAMQGNKWNYVYLSLSFLGWALLSSFVQYFLTSINVIIALATGMFLNLALNTYMNGSFAAFYLAVSGTGFRQTMDEGSFERRESDDTSAG